MSEQPAPSPATIDGALLPFELELGLLSHPLPPRCYRRPGGREARMASFKLWPKWRVEQDQRAYGWLFWTPGAYIVTDIGGHKLDQMSGPKTMDAVTQPSRRARDFALRVLGVPPKGDR